MSGTNVTYTLHKARVLVVSIFLAFAFLAATTVVPANPFVPTAAASTAGGGGGFTGGTGDSGTGGSLSPPPTSGTGGGGGSTAGTAISSPPPTCTGWCDYVYSRIDDFGDPPFYVGADQARAQCAGNPDAVGARVVFSVSRNYDSEPTLSTPERIVSITCLVLTYTDRTEYCYISATVTIAQVQGDASRSYPSPIASRTVPTAWGSGNKTLASCAASRSAQVAIGVSLVEYGRYTAPAYILQEAVIVRYYGVNPINGSQKAPELRSSSGVSAVRHTNNYAQKTCAGTQISQNRNAAWTGTWTWEETDCGPNSSNPRYQCNVGGTPIINGQPVSNATLYRNGEPNSISWQSPSITGQGMVSAGSPRTYITRSGTPWNSLKTRPVTDNDFKLSDTPTGPSILTSNEGNTFRNGLLTNYSARAEWASDKNMPTVLTPNYRWTGVWLRQTTVITGYNMATGALTTSTANTTTTADADCAGPPANLNFVRSVTSN